MEDGWKAHGENCKVWSGSQQLSVLACLWSCDPPVFLVLCTFMSGLTNAMSCFAVSHTMAWYMSCLCCAGKTLHGITTKHKKEDFKLYLFFIYIFIYLYIFDFGIASCRALNLILCQAGLFPLPVLLQGWCWTPSLSMPELAVRTGSHTWAHCGAGGSETVAFLAMKSLTTTWLAFPIVMPELLRAKPSPPAQPALWTPEPHAQRQGKSRAQQVFGAADPSLSHHSLSCKFLWICPWLQINAGWGPPLRPSPSRCSCGFYWHEEEP